MVTTQEFHSSRAAEPVGHFPHAKKVGHLLFLSGIGPRERGNKKIPGVTLGKQSEVVAYDFEIQCHAVFKNIKYILEESGSSLNQLVDVTVFLTNMKADFPAFNRIWTEYFPENPPCRTTLEVNCLPTPIAIELKCIATV